MQGECFIYPRVGKATGNNIFDMRGGQTRSIGKAICEHTIVIGRTSMARTHSSDLIEHATVPFHQYVERFVEDDKCVSVEKSTPHIALP